MDHSPTLHTLLSAAMKPIGTTLYVYGGGWNREDTGAAEETRTVGISPQWREFFEQQTVLYTYRNDKDLARSYYPHDGVNVYHALGLDCSGYIGWTLYNTLCTENGREGFVTSSQKLAKVLGEKGFGTFSKDHALRPGDVVSMKGHVWLCVGACGDGSIVIAHSTPSLSRSGEPGGGVQLTALCEPNFLCYKNCEAYRLADYYMKTYFAAWYERYPVVCRSMEQYTRFDEPDTGKFSWDFTSGPLHDPDDLHRKGADEILALLFTPLEKTSDTSR